MEVPLKQQQLSVDEIKKQSFLKKLSDNLLLIPNLPTPTTEQNNRNRDKKTMQMGSTLQNMVKQKKKADEDFLENNDEQQNVQKSVPQDFQFTKRFGKMKKLLNVFSVNRGQCIKCQPGECISYRCSFNIESFRGIEIFQCLNCGCPMNSHYILPQQGQFSNLICKYISRRYIKPGHFDFNGLTAIFFVDKVQAQNFEFDIETLVNILNEASYNVSSFYELELIDLQKIWMQKKLFSQQKKIPKEQFNGYVNFMDTFLMLFDYYNDEDLFNLRRRLNDTDNVDKLEFFMNLIEDVNKKLIWAYEQQKIAFIFLLTGRRADPYNDFKKLLKGATEYLPEELHYFYSSKNRYNALRDALLFFPSFFKLKISSFILTEQSKDQQKLEKMNDSFKDLLDFNNFSILSEKYTKQQLSSLYQAFEFLPNPERLLSSIQNQNDRQIQLKIVSKIGPQGLTILQQNMPNFYRISTEKENLAIQEKLCPNLSHNQRFIVIYRPIIVMSNLEEILNFIWSINDFVMIRSSYKHFTQQEALFLAQIEQIDDNNLNQYLQMMTNGFSMILLFSKPGGYQLSKNLILGCETGLRVRKSNILTEVSIDHTVKSGTIFKEKLPMNFYNCFESYTEQNIFKSIKGLFNLEELVLQENIDQLSKNIFMDDQDDQVFLSQKTEVKQTNISLEIRKQVIKDLSNENFNFFLHSTNDELQTEQLISLFLNDCSQVQQLYLIIKPQKNQDLSIEIKNSIEIILQRMNYYIISTNQYHFNEYQATIFIELISKFNLLDKQIKYYTKIYSSNPIYIISVAKAAGKYEMEAFLQNFSIEPGNETIPPSLVNDLHSYLLPCINIELFRFISKLINPFLSTFDGSLFEDQLIQKQDTDEQDEQQQEVQTLIPRKDQKKEVIHYMLITTFGIELDESQDFIVMNWDFYNVIKQINHVHIHVTSKDYGQFELRVRLLKNIAKYDLNLLTIQGEYQLLSWYYAKINAILKQRCPITYQYRIFHQSKAIKGEFDQVYDCQEYCGNVFLIEIYKQIFEFGNDVFNKMKEHSQENQKYIIQNSNTNNNNNNKNKAKTKNTQINQTSNNIKTMDQLAHLVESRSRVISYFWGQKLAKFTKEFELIFPDEFGNGYGPIEATEEGLKCKYKIHSTTSDELPQTETKRFKIILDRIIQYIQNKTDQDPKFTQDIENLCGSIIKKDISSNSKINFNNVNERMITGVEHIIKKYFDIVFGKEKDAKCSPILTYILDDQNLRLVPQMIDLTNLRIILDKQYIQTDSNAGLGFWMDCEYENREFKRKQQQQQKQEQQKEQEQQQQQQQKQQKQQQKSDTNFVSNKQPLNNFVLAYALPSVRSRFRLAGNIFYLLHIEIRLQKQYDNFLKWDLIQESDIIKNAVNEYNQTQDIQKNHQFQQFYHWFKDESIFKKEQMMEALIKGFEDSYFIEEEVIQSIKIINNENNKGKKMQLPDPLQLEIFLLCLEQLNSYLNISEEIQVLQTNLQKKQFLKLQLQSKWRDDQTKFNELKQQEENIQEDLKKLEKRKQDIDKQIFTIFKYISDDEFSKKFFLSIEDNQKTKNQIKQKEENFNINFYIDQIQDNLLRMTSFNDEQEMHKQIENYYSGKNDRNFTKEFIASKYYFQPIEQGNNQQSWGKLDQTQIDNKMKTYRDQQIDKFKQELDQQSDAPFIKNLEKDDIQKQWIEQMKYTQVGKFVDKRPDNKKTGILVDKAKKIDQNLDDKIDKVIKKFMIDKMHNFKK